MGKNRQDLGIIVQDEKKKARPIKPPIETEKIGQVALEYREEKSKRKPIRIGRRTGKMTVNTGTEKLKLERRKEEEKLEEDKRLKEKLVEEEKFREEEDRRKKEEKKSRLEEEKRKQEEISKVEEVGRQELVDVQKKTSVELVLKSSTTPSRKRNLIKDKEPGSKFSEVSKEIKNRQDLGIIVQDEKKK